MSAKPQEGFRLSPHQKHLWLLEEFDKSKAYRSLCVVQLKGTLHREILQAAVADVIRRRQLLRTRFRGLPGMVIPLQIVHDRGEFSLVQYAWNQFGQDEQDVRTTALFEEMARWPFDLEQGPLLHVALASLSPQSHRLFLCTHALCGDRAGLRNLVYEISHSYASLSQGEELSTDHVQYVALSEVFNDALTGKETASGRDFWRQKNFIELTGLPSSFREQSSEAVAFSPRLVSLSLDEILPEVETAATRRETTLEIYLLTCWCLLLSRLKEQTTLTISVAHDARSYEDLAGELGPLTKFLPIRVDLPPPRARFDEALSRVEAEADEALELEAYFSWEQMQEVAGASARPLFAPLSFAFADSALQLETPELTFTIEKEFACDERYELKLSCLHGYRSLEAQFHYDPAIHSEDVVRRLAEKFWELLQSTLTQPEQAIGDLNLVSDVERWRILSEFNRTCAAYELQTCLHILFEEQVRRTANNVAVVSEHDSLTYDQLNIRANRLAGLLRTMGVGPETLVAICLTRSAEMVVAMLGTLKAGGAYVPLDPEYPKDRLSYMLDNSGAQVLLTESQLLELLPAHAARTVCLDNDAETEFHSTNNPVNLASPDSPAYVLFTSGSTGQPKGVTVTHRALCNHMFWMQQTFRLTQEDSVLQKTPFSFDASVWEFYAPLLAGSRLVIARPGGHRDGAYLVKVINEEGVTFLQLVPSLLRMLIQTPGFDTCHSLRNVFCGGGVLTAELVNSFRSRLGAELHNLYGPTEATVDATFWTCPSEPARRSVPIGRPVSNAQVYILDHNLRPMPVHTPGEIYIAGECLARGYHRDPSMTAERFVPNPFSNSIGARMYKTGDLGYYRDSGDIEFTGRLDHQFKIRGMRIEAGELEAALCRHPAVREAVVVVRERNSGDESLVAYIISTDRATAAGELFDFLKEKLPKHMLPSAFVSLDSFPLLPNGKLDYHALPAPEKARLELKKAFVAPQTEIEKKLAAIWAEVLGVENVGIHDNFFELGGDSILSIQIVARADAAGVEISPKQFFQHQTIAELAAGVGTRANSSPVSADVTGAVPLTPIQRRFFDIQTPKPHHFNQAVLLEVRRPVEATLLKQTFEHLLLHHDALRLRFVCDEDKWKQTNESSGEPVPFIHVDLSDYVADARRAAIEKIAAETGAGLDLSDSPLLNVVHFDLGPTEPSRLLIVIHHLAVDGVSWRILLKDVQTIYEQLAAGEVVQLPSKSTSFKEWAERLADYASTRDWQQELDFWLAAIPREVPRLPIDFEGDNVAASEDVITVSLSAEETKTLLRHAPAVHRLQINEVLLTGLAQSFHRWTSNDLLLLDLEGHGREILFEDVDLSRTVGWFTSIFPLALRARDGSVEPAAALTAIQAQLRSIPLGGVGYGIARYLSGDEDVRRKLSALPQAEVSFNYLGQLDQTLADVSIFAPAAESCAPLRAPETVRPHLLEINALVLNGQLQVTCTYSTNVHRRSSIERLAQEYLKSLRELVQLTRAPLPLRYLPSDFALASISEKQLGSLTEGGEGIEDIYPLSPMQQGMLFHTRHAPQSGAYCEQLQSTLRGSLDAKVFRRAWQTVIDRHSILRSAFIWDGMEEPFQVVRRAAEVPWLQLDWSEIAAPDQEAMLEKLLAEDRARGFDLTRPPLMRMALIHKDVDVYEFILSHHHILLDGWSLPIVVKEVFAFYDSFKRGLEPRLETARPYRDYIAWLREQDLTEAERYWRWVLGGFTDPTPLTFRRASGSATEPSFGEEHLTLDVDTTAALRDFARRQQLTLNSIFQLAWALLISRYSGEDDVLFGAVFSGRPPTLKGVESMVGLLINTLPVRVKIDPAETVASLLKRQQRMIAEMGRFEYSPLAQVQKWSDVPSASPLFESIFVFENYPLDASLRTRIGEMDVLRIRSFGQTNYPLTVGVETGDELLLRVIHDRRFFDTADARQILEHLQNVVLEIADGPKRPVSEISLLSQAERRQILEAGGDPISGGFHNCVHRLFEAQAERAPDCVALSHAEERLTYGELNEQSNWLAHELIEGGLVAKHPVAVLLDSPVSQTIALLGVLKAGGVFVCLSPQHPSAYIRNILREVEPSALLTDSLSIDRHTALWEELEPGGGGAFEVVVLDRTTANAAPAADVRYRHVDLMRHAANNPEVAIGPGDAAYLAYTSGSTGKPKGIVQSHRNLSQFISWFKEQFELRAPRHVAQWASITYDAAYIEIFATLCSGATLCLVGSEIKHDPQALARWLKDEEIYLLQTTPSFCKELLRALESGKTGDGASAFPHWKLMLLAGEALPAEIAAAWRQRFPKYPKLFNLYGPTETILATCYPIDCVDTGQHTMPIGRAIEGRQILILNKQQSLVPFRVPGEIYIRSSHLSDGYFRQPSETRKTFVPDPLLGETADRVYRTGDMGRLHYDGSLEFLGRMDNQVKLRGMRVELEDIEHVLSRHAAIKECAVGVHDYGDGDQRLVAYVVLEQKAAADLKVEAEWSVETQGMDRDFAARTELATQIPALLRNTAAQYLPEPMVPGDVVCLDSLPRTASGKIDRKNLPAPNQLRRSVSTEYTAPRTPTESFIATVWRDLLHVDEVGVNTNFFDLGGHSLLMTQVINKLKQEYSVEVPITRFFERPTVAGLAELIDSSGADAQAAEQTARLFETVEQLSDEEVIALLRKKREKLATEHHSAQGRK